MENFKEFETIQLGNTIYNLKEELTAEQYERFIGLIAKGKVQEAIEGLPEMNGNNIWVTVLNSRLKELRNEHGLTQSDLANMLNISQREYWRYEQPGYAVNIIKLAQIAVFYNISLDWISGWYPTKKPFYEGLSKTEMNGYVLADMKEAKAKKTAYFPNTQN